MKKLLLYLMISVAFLNMSSDCSQAEANGGKDAPLPESNSMTVALKLQKKQKKKKTKTKEATNKAIVSIQTAMY